MNIVCVGAHPDDPEFYAGGAMTLWAAQGHRVVAVSLTNGDAGHYETPPEALARRRAEESREAARRGGYEAIVLDTRDGELMPTLDARKALVRLLRTLQADVVISHRPWDYHPDHRYAGVLLQDAAFMVTVPHFCPDVPALAANPVFLGMRDVFTRAMPFRPDLLVAVDGVMPVKWSLLDAMASQVYEWLPWLSGRLSEVPAPEQGPGARLAWLKAFASPMLAQPAQAYGEELRAWYGEGAEQIIFAEVFEVCDYGRQPAAEELRRLCPAPQTG